MIKNFSLTFSVIHLLDPWLAEVKSSKTHAKSFKNKKTAQKINTVECIILHTP